MAAPVGKHATSFFGCKMRRIFLLTPHNTTRSVQPFRCSRTLKRTPIRVLTPEEADSLSKSKIAIKQNQFASRPGREQDEWVPSRPVARVSKGHTYQQPTEDPGRFTLPYGLNYEKLVQGDKRFGPVLMATKSRKLRERKEVILLEGKRLIIDAFDAGAVIKHIYFNKIEHLEGFPLEDMLHADFYKVDMSHLKLWSDLTTPPGVMAVCKMPLPGQIQLKEAPFPITLLCDNLRDPGNMGTLLRSAAAVGCQRVLLTKGCVDIWEPKVLRAGAGAHFKLHMLPQLGWELVGNYLKEDAQVLLADCSGQLTAELPKVPRWVMNKISSADTNKYEEKDEETEEVREVDESFLDEEMVKLFDKVPIPVRTYSEVDYTQGEVVVVIGGETEGVSAAARKLAFERNGDRVFIPMMAGVDSLNSAVAATLVLFEARKQLQQQAAAGARTERASRH